MSDNFTSPEGVEVRTNEDGTIDEIVTNKPVHTTFEYMDDDYIDLHIGDVQACLWTRKVRICTGVEGQDFYFSLGEFVEDDEKYPIESVYSVLDRLLDGFDGAAKGSAPLGEIEHKGEKVYVRIEISRTRGE